jgi:hypothetical protein
MGVDRLREGIRVGFFLRQGRMVSSMRAFWYWEFYEGTGCAGIWQRAVVNRKSGFMIRHIEPDPPANSFYRSGIGADIPQKKFQAP